VPPWEDSSTPDNHAIRAQLMSGYWLFSRQRHIIANVDTNEQQIHYRADCQPACFCAP